MANCRLRAGLLASVTLAAGVGLAGPVFAQVVDYPSGSTNTAPIVLTTDTVQLQVSDPIGSATQAGVISEALGSHGFEKIGFGNLILTAANTYSGNTLLTRGMLTIGHVQALGDGSLVIANQGGFLALVQMNVPLLQNDVVLQGGHTRIIATGPLTVSGSISGAGTLRFHEGPIAGSAVVLTGTNTFTGALRHNGVLQIGDGGTSGSVAANIEGGPATRLIFNRSDNFTYGGALRGHNFAGIEKLGAGTLTLTGEASINTSSEFLVSEGTLVINNNTVRGGRINVASGAHLIADSAITYAQMSGVTGAGSFTKVGTGTVTAQGIIDNTGGVTVSEGVLRIGSGLGSIPTELRVDAVVAAGAVIAFDSINSFSNSTYAFNISGGGVIRTDNVNTHILTGTNTNTGGVDIAFGVLQVGDGGTTGSISGPAVTRSNTSLTFNRSDTVVYSGAINGSGGLRQMGSGMLVLTGAVNPVIRTQVLAGTLSIGAGGTTGFIGGNILNNAALVFNRSDAVTYAGAISGTGTLAKQGAGTLTLTGINTFTGATTVAAGRLDVSGMIFRSAVTVAGGATLTGTGTVGSATIAAGGVLGSTGPTGVLSVVQGVSFAAGSTYVVDVAPGSASRVNATGTGSLNGAVTATYAPGSYIARRYNILSAQGGVTGSFSSLTNTNLPAGFQAALSYDANNAYIDLEILLPSLTGLNLNQGGVAAAIGDYFTRTGGIDPIYAVLTPDQLEVVAGETGAANATTGVRVADGLLSALSDQISRGRRGMAGSDGGRQDWNVWGRLDGSSATFGADDAVGYSETEITHRQFLVGADRALTSDLTVGLAYAAGTAEFENQRDGRGDADFYNVAVYGRLDSGSLYLGAAASTGSMDSTVTRTVQTGVTDTLRSVVESDISGARVEAGGRMAFGNIGVQPYFAAQMIRVDLPAYSETASGAGTFALDYVAEEFTSRRFEVGGRFETQLSQSNAGSAVLSFLLAGVHEESDDALTAAFTDLPGSPFASHGPVADGASVLVGAGISARLGRGLSIDGSVRGQFGAADSGAAQVSLRYAW